MRNVLFGIASLLAATTVAHADSLAASSHLTETAVPTTYFQLGGMAGGNDGYLTIGATAELGKLVLPHLWIHGSMTGGLAGDVFANGTGSILQARAGADLMGCHGSGGVLCGFVGADAGYQHTQYSSMSEAESRDRMIGVVRAGVDFGGQKVRWRPGIEASFAGDGINGINVTQSIAWRF